MLFAPLRDKLQLNLTLTPGQRLASQPGLRARFHKRTYFHARTHTGGPIGASTCPFTPALMRPDRLTRPRGKAPISAFTHPPPVRVVRSVGTCFHYFTYFHARTHPFTCGHSHCRLRTRPPSLFPVSVITPLLSISRSFAPHLSQPCPLSCFISLYGTCIHSALLLRSISFPPSCVPLFSHSHCRALVLSFCRARLHSY